MPVPPAVCLAIATLIRMARIRLVSSTHRGRMTAPYAAVIGLSIGTAIARDAERISTVGVMVAKDGLIVMLEEQGPFPNGRR